MAGFLYLDCGSGASGDMLVGALIDAGVPLESIRGALGSLELDGVSVTADRVVRAGISATKFRVSGPGVPETVDLPDHSDAHDHGMPGHGHDAGHAHRHLPQIVKMIERSALSPAARAAAIAHMERMATAEATIHGIPVQKVHLHEVGAVDSIVDVVSFVHALEWLNVSEVMASPLNTGSGTVRCAHGIYPVPAPATLSLAKGVPVFAAGPAVELLTPTGALLVTGTATSYGPMPSGVVERIGYGAGSRDFAARPNVVRAVVGRRDDAATADVVLEMVFEVDDMNPQFLGAFMEAALNEGVLDVYYTPVYMKKGRPGTLVTLLMAPEKRESIAALVFRETTSIGVRYHERQRQCLTRHHVTVRTVWGEIRIKVASSGAAALNAAPEFEDCARAAHHHGVAVKTVHAAALHAYMNRGAQ